MVFLCLLMLSTLHFLDLTYRAVVYVKRAFIICSLDISCPKHTGKNLHMLPVMPARGIQFFWYLLGG